MYYYCATSSLLPNPLDIETLAPINVPHAVAWTIAGGRGAPAMEAYPQAYVQHNLPLCLLSGLGERDGHGPDRDVPLRQENGVRIAVESPDCTSETARKLCDAFLRQDGSDHAWNAGALPGPSGRLKYRMKAIGMVGMGLLYVTLHVYIC